MTSENNLIVTQENASNLNSNSNSNSNSNLNTNLNTNTNTNSNLNKNTKDINEVKSLNIVVNKSPDIIVTRGETINKNIVVKQDDTIVINQNVKDVDKSFFSKYKYVIILLFIIIIGLIGGYFYYKHKINKESNEELTDD